MCDLPWVWGGWLCCWKFLELTSMDNTIFIKNQVIKSTDLQLVVVVQSLSCVQLFATPLTAAHQVPLSPRVCSHSCPLSWWCYLTVSSSFAHFSFCLQSFPASGSFPMSQFFGASASAPTLPMNIQGWFPLGLTSSISLQSKDSQESSPAPKFESINSSALRLLFWSNSHICTWLLEKP